MKDAERIELLEAKLRSMRERYAPLQRENSRLKATIAEVMVAYQFTCELHASWEDCAGNMYDRLKKEMGYDP